MLTFFSMLPKFSGCLMYSYHIFPRVILNTVFLILFIYGGLGFWGCSLILGFWGWGFQLMGCEACGVELCGFFGYGALYKNIKE